MPRREEVNRWFRDYDNPMKDVVLAVRDAVLAADPRMDECIKWKAPTFTAPGAGNLASFFPRSKQHASLMFHEGAKIPGRHARLTGDGETSRVLKLGTVAEVAEARAEIEAIVAAWLGWKQGGAKKAGVKKAGAKKAGAKKAVAKKAAAKKVAAKKVAKKAAAKKVAKKTAAKKAGAKKLGAKKSGEKKPGAKKAGARKKTTRATV